jgi:MFS family permease
MAVGPMIAVIGKLTIGIDATLIAASVLTVVVAMPTMLAHWPSTPVAADGLPEVHPPLRATVGLLRHRSVVAAALVITAFFLPIGAYDALFPRFLTDLGAPDWMLGLALLAFAVPSIFLAGWAGRLVDRVGPFTAAGRGGIANIVVIAGYAMVRLPVVVVAIGLFESGGQALVGAAGAAAMGWAVPGRRAATAQGLGEAVGTMAGAVMAGFAAPLYAAGGPAALFGVTAVVTGVALVAGVRLGAEAEPVEHRLVAPVPVVAPVPA